ncbi:MAG TPA: Co2+/Mg2+ efflux protein ApaG [Cellvibrionaceae bacterium]|jgi:ApaG protein|nr:Co2+/Mg2+ efflux protein ApaG [Cellvibrionaceae bacterium]HMW46979.1 Co2+/Mg2+ efflux protein ApaG [Cellvibrionaceae bacterium]HMW70870.1 Co2+/Mg2+ efflux protein ApaG [Cellvibrionaceae bacterium]HMY38395.1 Co2+/Mg2+ efflux protein ApaG [Marinagarivorans sp.]HNG59803.1 Co2+/Mg2+ efflux protein ApaG [Cellvibrionaceae bacterium]
MQTDDIQVSIKTQYLSDQSEPAQERFVFAYTITIANKSDQPAQLISRHWIITDGNNQVQEVQGIGVVGQQPRLDPGASYTYTSGVVLPTGMGTMTGTYQMRLDNGDEFDAPIPTFALIHPQSLH